MTRPGHHQRYRASKEVVATRLDGESMVLLDMETAFYFDLNRTGAFVWDRLADGKMMEEITQALVQTFEVDEPRARRDTEALVGELLESALIVARDNSGTT